MSDYRKSAPIRTRQSARGSDGEVWRALNSGEDQRHKNDIDVLLVLPKKIAHLAQNNIFKQWYKIIQPQLLILIISKTMPCAEEKMSIGMMMKSFDELLAAVPNGKTATDVHSPFNTPEPVSHLHVVEDPIAVAEVANP